MELVKVNQNKVFADSRIIADTFGKAHRNVMRDIESLIENLNENNAQNITLLFSKKNYKRFIRKWAYN